jgi:hypothetical protein
MIDLKIWEVFRGIGIPCSLVDVVQRVSFREIILSESGGFKEL